MNIKGDICTKKLHYFSKYDEKLNVKSHLNPKLLKLISSYPNNLYDLSKHIIFYGPAGVGKYLLALKLIRRYSPSKLKYEKKLMISSNKTVFMIKMSDVHFEIDMTTLGCNSKVLWHDIFLQVLDTISFKKEQTIIILCKCFHEINSELLEIFYSYLQFMNNKFCFNVHIKFILLTEYLSFIPENILTCCDVISVPRPSLTRYKKCINDSLESTNNVKNIANHIDKTVIISFHPFKIICDDLITFLLTKTIDIKLITVRDYIYDLLIYNLNIHDCMWYITETIHPKVPSSKKLEVVILFYKFFHYYNNNYRPIYHFEWLIFSLHGLLHDC